MFAVFEFGHISGLLRNSSLIHFLKKMATDDVGEKAFRDEEMANTTAKKDWPSRVFGKASAEIDASSVSSVDLPVDKRRKTETAALSTRIDSDAVFAYRVQQEEDQRAAEDAQNLEETLLMVQEVEQHVLLEQQQAAESVRMLERFALERQMEEDKYMVHLIDEPFVEPHDPRARKCFVCGNWSLAILTLDDGDCPHSACSHGCYVKLNNRWLDIKYGLLEGDREFNSDSTQTESDVASGSAECKRSR